MIDREKELNKILNRLDHKVDEQEFVLDIIDGMMNKNSIDTISQKLTEKYKFQISPFKIISIIENEKHNNPKLQRIMIDILNKILG